MIIFKNAPINFNFNSKDDKFVKKNSDNNVKYDIIEKNSNDLQYNTNPLDLQKNFLTLLVAQIKNQDPTDPLKNTELTSQLAQINTASGIERLNNTANKLSHQIQKNQNIQLSSLIGHHVMIHNKTIVHTQNVPTKFGIELIGNATSVQIQITDKNKKVLYIKNLKDTKADIYNFFWDGKDLDNKSVMTGKYDISVIAKNEDQDVPVNSLSEALVNSVIFSSNNPVIDLGTEGNVIFSEIYEIS